MAKKQESEIVPAVAGELAVPESLRGGLIVEGDDSPKGARMARLALYQGTSEEEERYGKFERGVFIDTLEKRVVNTDAVMFLGGFVTWSKWSQGAKTPDYTFRKKSDVPAEDLQGFPPVATKCYNMVIIVNGEPWPYLMRIKRTAAPVYENVIQANEDRRAAAGKGPGCYKLASKADKNAAGQTYRRLDVSRLFEPPAEMIPLAESVKAQLADWKARADALAAEDDGSAPKDLPI